MKIASWNVNGLRAVAKRNFLTWMIAADFDILCLQEIKVGKELLPPNLTRIEGYKSYFNFATKKGYSGVAVYTKQTALKVSRNIFAHSQFNDEGRALLLEFESFSLLNIYIPHGGRNKSKLTYKLAVYKELLAFLSNHEGKPLIIAGDFNVAHQNIDLARPKQNRNSTMFTPEERAQLDELTQIGFIDSYRWLYPEKTAYTWWLYMANARERNMGWRIDYIFIHGSLRQHLKEAGILGSFFGSDHCPVSVELSEVGFS